MPTHIAVPVLSGNAENYARAGTNYLIETPAGVYYWVGMDASDDVSWTKSTDRGLTWTTPVVIRAGKVEQLSVWYDEWSGVAGGKNRTAYTEGGSTDDVLYRDLDVDDDSLGTETTIFNGATGVVGGAISIVTARSGYVYCLLCIDAGTESEFALSTDGGATWDLTRASAGSFESATQDQWALLPGWAADSNDIMCIFWDASNDELSRKLYDHDGDAWSETSISTGMVDTPATAFPHFAVAVDTTNSRNLVVAWNAVDGANADLLGWHVTEGAITALTNIVTNGTDDQGLCAIGINTITQDWTVFYAGKSDGPETWPTSLNIYYKVSTDDGVTWGAETKLSATAQGTRVLNCVPRSYSPPLAMAQQSYASDGAGPGFAVAFVPLRGPVVRSQVGC